MVTLEKLLSPRFLMSRVLWYTGAGRFLVIARSGYKLRVFPTALTTALWLDRSERIEDERFLQTYLTSGDTFLDIGANIGTHALAAASRVGPAGRVLAFEPHPKTYRYLGQNIALNGFRNIETFCLGLGDISGLYRFGDDKCDDQNGVLESNEQASAKAIDVQIARLDDFSFPRLDLVKIDAEGYELPIIRGGRETLRRVQCVFYESWERHFARHGSSCQEIQELLESLGFRLFRMSGDEEITAVSSGYSSRTCENLLALRDEQDFVRRTGYTIAG